MIASVSIFPHFELCKLFLQQKIIVYHTLQKIYINQMLLSTSQTTHILG